MKLTNVSAMLKSNAVKLLTGAALAGAVLTAAAPAAQAQRVFFGVHVGGPAFYGPRYYAPPPPVVYARPGFYAGYGPGFYGPHFHHIDRWGHRW